MRKIGSATFLIFTAILIFTAQAVGSPFSACQNPALKPGDAANSLDSLTSEKLSLFAVRFGQTFQSTIVDGLRDIDINVRCLNLNSPGTNASDLCEDRRNYFLKTIPKQWTAFRQAIALSSYSQRFILLKDERRPYNIELQVPSYSRATESAAQPLEGSELEVADREWNTQWNLAKKIVIGEIEERLSRKGQMGPVEASAFRDLHQAKQLLESWPPHIVFRSHNAWARKAFRDIDSIFFQLNRKRTLQLLARYPILAHLNEKEVTPTAIILALNNQRHRLLEESNRVSTLLTEISQKQEVAPIDLQSVFDYHFVADLAIANSPDLCATATAAFQNIERRTQIKSAVLLLGMVGLTPFVPLTWTLIGASAMQSIALYDAYQKEGSSKNLAYGFSSPDLAVNSAEDVFLDRTRIENEWMLSASIVTGLPLMRLSKFAIRSLPAVKAGSQN